MNKREFLQIITSMGLTTAFWQDLAAFDTNQEYQTLSRLSNDEEKFWKHIRSLYELKPDYINLENGWYNIIPKPILKAYFEEIHKLNLEGTYYMRTRLFDDNIEVRKQLAQLVGCSYEELIITRNTTESIDTVIAGIDWKPGDEVIFNTQEYPAMIDMFKVQARRYGIVNKIISIPNDPKSDEEIVSLYEKAITPKTRVILVSHIINITGHILPVRKICDMARNRGIFTIVDGAHAVAHFDFKISDLNCDAYASSLHKWLSVPLGAGMLYLRKDRIKEIWCLFGETAYPDEDIRKLNHIGTHPAHTVLTIPASIEFYQKIGAKRKENRLRYVQEYWTSKVRGVPNIFLNTPSQSHRACGIANVGIQHIKPANLAKILLEKYKIWTVAIDHPEVQGVRITPNIFTTTDELDKLVAALIELSKK
ncbi:MAG: aminotransferase class V-fold PLP-dependent enzyme [Bacteroidia bacterium]|nr:aminotransferase class V-fold PLP-dependent enzyme [Bacteroidia bacterium]